MTINCWRPARLKYGVAVANYNTAMVLHALPLTLGESVHIWEEYWDSQHKVSWLRGCSFLNKKKKGIFPAAYIQQKEYTVENEGPSENVTPVEDAIVKEVNFVLREWDGQCKALFVRGDPLFHTIFMIMGKLCKFRSIIVSNTLSKEHAEIMKQRVVTKIDWGNGKLGLDLVPRIDNRQVEPDNVSVVDMFRIHETSVLNRQVADPCRVRETTESERQLESVHHLLVCLCSFACSVGDNSEVLLSLYDSKEGRFISEKFVMYFTRDGEREGTDKNNSTIFTDLSSEDISKDLYLVLQILRRGRLLAEGNFKKMANYHYRRPWGVSVLSLKEMSQMSGEQEYFLRVQCVDESFHNMHENLIKKQIQLSGKTASGVKLNQGITLSLALLYGDMKTIRVEHPILFSKGVVLTQRMGFPDYINPGEVRNDLYLTLIGAEFDRGSKTASKNVEVRITVYNDQYELIQDCILLANGESMKPNFLSFVLYHNNSPKWNETIRLAIPTEKFSTAHIRLEFCHCSNRDKAEKKMLGFAYLPVTTKEDTTRLDGKYDLCIYKCEDFTKVKNYLKLPCLKDDVPHSPSSIPYHHSNKEYVSLETFLCSSKFAQKAELLNVLQWASKPDPVKSIPESLDNLVKLKGQELVRYLQDILDALFNMFTVAVESNSTLLASNIFEALVFIFNLLREEMFEKFSFVLEDYLEKSFSSTLAYREIMRCLKEQAENVYTCTSFDERFSQSVFKVLEDIFKFCVASFILSQRMYNEQSVHAFRKNLDGIFQAFGKVVSSHEEVLQSIQSQLLVSLHQTYTPLLRILGTVDLAKLVVFTLGRINQHQGAMVLLATTTLVKNTINSQLFSDNTSRSMLLPLILDHLKECLTGRHHLHLTVATLGDLLSTIFRLQETSEVTNEVTEIIQQIFEAVVTTLGLLLESKHKTDVSLLVACLTEMLRLIEGTQHAKLSTSSPQTFSNKVSLSAAVIPRQPLAVSKVFLSRVLLVFRSLVKANNFPTDWTTMTMITNRVIMASVQLIAEDLRANCLKGSNFDKELWLNFFLLTVDFITQPCLQLENYSEAKSSQIKNKYKDMRIPLVCTINSVWNSLEQNREQIMLDLIGPFLKSSMIPHQELRKTIIPMFWDIMKLEYQLKAHLRMLESLMFQELDSLVLDHHGDDAYKTLLQTMLLDKMKSESGMEEEGTRFISSITDLLERLLEYRQIMTGEEQRDTQMHCTFSILNFYKGSRQDMYIRYIARLYDLHYSAGHFVEAGHTLWLHADLLKWSDTIHPAEMSYPQQTEAERKAALYSQIIDCYDKGKAWEYGIRLFKELAEHYDQTFKYKKLAAILKQQASFLYNILEGEKVRQKPSYYRIAYIGSTFPAYLKNKSFIYHGDECLKLSTIMNRLTNDYPMATILTTNSPLSESCKHGDAQYIQIISVQPIPPMRLEFEGKEVPDEITFFYKSNEVDTFQFDRPYHRGQKDSNNEFKSLCLERTIMKTSHRLPGILRWYEVVETEEVHLMPVQTAIKTVQQMNAELKRSLHKAVENPALCLGHLEMRLHGVISGAVNGGIPKYQEAFFCKDYISQYPEESNFIDELKILIQEQINLLENGLSVHEKLASSEMLPLHASMVDMFTKLRHSLGYRGSGNKANTVSTMELPASDSKHSSRVSSISSLERSPLQSSIQSVSMNDISWRSKSREQSPQTSKQFQRMSCSSGTTIQEGRILENSTDTTPSQPPPLPVRKSSRTGSFTEPPTQVRSSVIVRSESANSKGSSTQLQGRTLPEASNQSEQARPRPPLPTRHPPVLPASNKTPDSGSLDGAGRKYSGSSGNVPKNGETGSDVTSPSRTRKISVFSKEGPPPPVTQHLKPSPNTVQVPYQSSPSSDHTSQSAPMRSPPPPPPPLTHSESVETPSAQRVGPPPIPRRKQSETQ